MQLEKRFPDESRAQYRVPNLERLFENGNKVLMDMVANHIAVQRPRLDALDDYYEGNNITVLQKDRRKEDHLADHRATHNFAKYVSQFIQGYLVGIPLKTVYPESDKVDEALKDINRENDADAHNSDLILDLSIYGRAYELLYRGQDDITRFTISKPLETFVIYDMTVGMNPVAGVRYFYDVFNDDELHVHLYTPDELIQFVGEDYAEVVRDGHSFGGVPIIEYTNNRFRQGDYEDVLSLIDLYDSAQSDTANYMQDLNDAMLLIIGNVEMDASAAKQMKDNNLMLLQSEPTQDGKESKLDARYIYKQYDVAGSEAYKTRVFDDILLFCSVPNLLDTNFSGTQSGEALKMKLFGLEQKRATKERLFKRSLRERYRLIKNMMTIVREGDFDVNNLLITFTPNMPTAIGEELKNFIDLGGRLSEETMLSLVSIVENPQEEMARIRKEDEAAGRSRLDYNFPDEKTTKDGESNDKQS